jgi:cell division protein FtsQ
MKIGFVKHAEVDSRSSANRAEEVRSRRTQRSQKRVSTITNRVVNPVNPRPVIVRSNTRQGFPTKGNSRKSASSSMPIYNKAGTRARRQLYLTMDAAAGTELRLPAIPFVNPGWRLASGLIAILAIIGLYSLWSSPFFQVSTVDVKGLQRLTAQDINSELKLENQTIVLVDAGAIQRQLITAFPELQNVQVNIQMPNYVNVTATERQPVMAVQKGDQVSWIDAEGIIFPAHGDAGKLVTIQTNDDLPAAPAPIEPAKLDSQNAAADGTQAVDPKSTEQAKILITADPHKVDPTLIAAAQALSQKLPADTPLVYSNKDGLGWNDPQGWQVFIGKDLDNFEEKYAVYQELAKYLLDQGLKPVLISVEQLNAPFYRLEQ